MSKHELMGIWAAKAWRLAHGFYTRSRFLPPDLLASERYDRRFQDEKSFTHKQEYVKGFTGEINKGDIKRAIEQAVY